MRVRIVERGRRDHGGLSGQRQKRAHPLLGPGSNPKQMAFDLVFLLPVFSFIGRNAR
jgi:hypothetical protein